MSGCLEEAKERVYSRIIYVKAKMRRERESLAARQCKLVSRASTHEHTHTSDGYNACATEREALHCGGKLGAFVIGVSLAESGGGPGVVRGGGADY